MIRLRPWKKMDHALLPGWFADEAAFAKWSNGVFIWPFTAEQFEAYQKESEQRGDRWSLAALDDAGNTVGHIMIRQADFTAESAYLGFIILSPSMRGKGAGKQMVSQALRYAGTILGMKTATLGVFANNPAAIGCYEALGFTEVGRKPAALEFHGEVWDLIQMKAEL